VASQEEEDLKEEEEEEEALTTTLSGMEAQRDEFLRAGTAGQEVIMEGPIWQRAGVSRGHWKHRHAVLTPTCLFVKTPLSDGAKNAHALPIVSLHHPHGKATAHMLTSEGHDLVERHAFEVTTPLRHLHLASDSLDNAAEWVACLQSLCDGSRRSTVSAEYGT
jgi:hypothetical protein